MDTQPSQPSVLLLGTGHLANHNRDVFNTQFDDMLAERRQLEIRDCAERLKQFRPTKVAIERDTDQGVAINQEYERYRSGQLSLTADEIHQLGFRIAAELDHREIYCIDWNEPIGDMDVMFSFARVHQPEIYAELMAPGERLDQEEAKIRTTSVREMLLSANDPESLRQGHKPYLSMARIGEGKRYVGIDWVQGWYGRNLRIYANLTRTVTSTEDRVLVIYGAGHIPLLIQFIRDGALYHLESVERYLG